MKKAILRAPVLTQSGYGVHARQVARWLLSRDGIELSVNAMPWGDTPWYIDATAQGGLVGALMERTRPPESLRGHDSVSFQLQLPHEWDPNLADVNIGMTAGVETDRCHPEWITACNRMTAIVVPSRHVEACFRASGTITVPVHVVPEAWSSECALHDDELPKLPTFETDKNVLLFGQLTGTNPLNDRKNTFFAIKWLCELFADDPRVGIILKTNACRNTLIDRDIVLNTVRGILAQVRSTKNGPKLHLLHGDMSDLEVAALYRHPQVNMLVAPTRGEGFGLPLLEAAASGLPIAATSWSGHTDFLGDGYTPIKYNLETVHQSRVDGKIFVHDARWASPHEFDFKRRVKDMMSAGSVDVKKKAEALKAAVLVSHAPSKIYSTYDAVLGAYL